MSNVPNLFAVKKYSDVKTHFHDGNEASKLEENYVSKKGSGVDMIVKTQIQPQRYSYKRTTKNYGVISGRPRNFNQVGHLNKITIIHISNAKLPKFFPPKNSQIMLACELSTSQLSPHKFMSYKMLTTYMPT